MHMFLIVPYNHASWWTTEAPRRQAAVSACWTRSSASQGGMRCRTRSRRALGSKRARTSDRAEEGSRLSSSTTKRPEEKTWTSIVVELGYRSAGRGRVFCRYAGGGGAGCQAGAWYGTARRAASERLSQAPGLGDGRSLRLSAATGAHVDLAVEHISNGLGEQLLGHGVGRPAYRPMSGPPPRKGAPGCSVLRDSGRDSCFAVPGPGRRLGRRRWRWPARQFRPESPPSAVAGAARC